jgi:hypothetical protein
MGFKRIGIIAIATVGVAGCGSGTHFANHPAPPVPVNLTVYINNESVSVSPNQVGAGPVILIVTNQARTAESLTILPAGTSAAQPIADTGPINPQATTQLTVNLNHPGAYTVGIAPNASTEASAALPSGVKPALLRVGHPRPSGSNELLQP